MSDSAVNLKGKNFLKLLDFTPDEIMYLLDLAAKLKAEKKAGIPHRLCEGKNVALIFEKTSTRTRCAFEVAAHDLGMGTTYLSPDASQIGKKESIHDTARVLGRMFDGIEYRGWGQEIVEELAACAGVPVWNGLTNEFHPTQVLADLLMLRERFGSLRGLSLAYYGDARYNMGNSLMVGCALTGVNFTACAPDGYFPAPELIARCRELAAASGGSVNFVTDPERGSAGADAVYTDVWVSMGEPSEVWAERINALLPYRVTPAVMAKAAPGAVFMHCLPAFHDLGTAVGRDVYGKFGLSELEVSDAVFSSPASVVFDEAQNRMHTIKAVMAATL